MRGRERVAVFIDYQNTYMRARESFHGLAIMGHAAGQFNPLSLAQVIVDRGLTDRELAAVRVYRGQPVSKYDSKGYSANRRQTDAWKRLDDRVHVYNRPLRYSIDDQGRRVAREKGVDVALAVDFVMTLAFGEYDTGVLMSGDTDLVPALEAVMDIGGRPYPRCETACWSPPISLLGVCASESTEFGATS